MSPLPFHTASHEEWKEMRKNEMAHSAIKAIANMDAETRGWSTGVSAQSAKSTPEQPVEYHISGDGDQSTPIIAVIVLLILVLGSAFVVSYLVILPLLGV